MKREPPEGWWSHRYISDQEILLGWKRGLDTFTIASKYFVPEHVVANRLPRLLLADRLERQQSW